MTKWRYNASTKALIAVLLGLVWWGGVRSAAAAALPALNPKVQVAQRVYDELVQVIGDGRTPPQMQILAQGGRGRMKVAWFLPRAHTITLEERAYDLCVAQGADSLDALAALLGHELAHFYQDHGWVGDFGNGFADLEVGQMLGDLQQNPVKVVELEAEADYFGGYFGYMAGYNTLQATPSLLESIYTEYALDGDMEGYPALAERQEIARRSQDQLGQLVPVFEAGQQLLLIGHYPEAARCFEFIGRTFPSREIHNNAGVAWLQGALELGAAAALDLVLPVELDGQTRLRQEQAGARGERSGLDAKQMIEAGRMAFERARVKDPQYSTAYTNLACLALVRGESQAALNLAEEAVLRASTPRSRAHALIARGIARTFGAGGKEEAAADFAAAQRGDAELAAVNLALLQGRDLGRSRAGVEGPAEGAWGPGDKAYEALVQTPRVRLRIDAGRAAEENLYLYAGLLAGGEGLIVDTGQATWSFRHIRTAEGGTSARGIGVGSRLSQVLEAYGAADRVVAGRQTNYRVYADERVIFAIDAGGRVEGWTVFTGEALFYEPTVEAPKPERRTALVVGNGGYANAPLRNAVNDARAVGQALEATGFAVDLLLDADRRQLRQAIRAFGQQLRDGGVGLFYYAGHGIQVGGLNYLVPVGSDVAHEDEVADECVLVSSVMRKMESADNRVNIAILDACRNNPFARSFRSGSSGLARMDAAVGSILAYATGPGKVAADGTEGNGLYTAKLLDYMQVPGLKIEEVLKRVRVAVKAASQDRQVPWDSSSLTGDFYFVPPAAAAAGLGYASGAGLADDMVHVADFGFYIDRQQVSNAQYRAFLQAMGNQTEGGVPWLDAGDGDALIQVRQGDFQVRPGFEGYPVVEVSWYGARRYCAWSGKRLPAAQEWQWAALGATEYVFPWGQEATGARANFDWGQDGYQALAPLGRFAGGDSPYGAQDMAGNVWEWVDEGDGGRKLLLGGSWATEPETWRQPYWSDPSLTMDDAGFRCVRDP